MSGDQGTIKILGVDFAAKRGIVQDGMGSAGGDRGVVVKGYVDCGSGLARMGSRSQYVGHYKPPAWVYSHRR